MPEPSLFEVDPVPPPQPPDPGPTLGRDARRTLRLRALIERGRHPVTMQPLHPDAPADCEPGQRGRPFTCGTCTHLVSIQHHNRWYSKCDRAEMTHGPGSDIRGWWPACRLYEGIADDGA